MPQRTIRLQLILALICHNLLARLCKSPLRLLLLLRIVHPRQLRKRIRCRQGPVRSFHLDLRNKFLVVVGHLPKLLHLAFGVFTVADCEVYILVELADLVFYGAGFNFEAVRHYFKLV